MIECIAAVAVVRMDVGELAHLRPGRRGADRTGDAVGRLDRRNPEDVFRLGDDLVEQEVRAPVSENGQQLKLLRHRTERRRVAARNDAGEQIDVVLHLQPAHLLDIGVHARRLVCPYRLDLAFAEEAALRVDLFRRKGMSLDRWFRHHGQRTGQERHVGGHIGLVGNVALDLAGRSRCVDQRGRQAAGGGARGGGADGDAHPAQEFPASDVRYFGHAIRFGHDSISFRNRLISVRLFSPWLQPVELGSGRRTFGQMPFAALQQSSVTPALPESTGPG